MEILKQLRDLEKSVKEVERIKQENKYLKEKVDYSKKDFNVLRSKLQEAMNELNVISGNVNIGSNTKRVFRKNINELLNQIVQKLYLDLKVDEKQITTKEIQEEFIRKNLNIVNHPNMVKVRKMLLGLHGIRSKRVGHILILYHDGTEPDQEAKEKIIKLFGKDILVDKKESDIKFEKVNFMG